MEEGKRRYIKYSMKKISLERDKKWQTQTRRDRVTAIQAVYKQTGRQTVYNKWYDTRAESMTTGQTQRGRKKQILPYFMHAHLIIIH